MGHAGMGWCGDGVEHVDVRWGGSCRGGVGHAGMGSGESLQKWDGVGHENIKMLKILNYWCYRVSHPANQNQIYGEIS